MKKITFFLLFFVAIFGSQKMHAESYQRWIYWVSDSTHVSTADEMAEIVQNLVLGNVLPNEPYTLSNGVEIRIPEPDVYLEYIIMCVKEGEPSITTTEDVINAIRNGDVVKWGNDINFKVKNYYFSTAHNEVRFMDNYSGEEKAVPVLLVNEKPKLKLDCGNPLVVILDNDNDNALKAIQKSLLNKNNPNNSLSKMLQDSTFKNKSVSFFIGCTFNYSDCQDLTSTPAVDTTKKENNVLPVNTEIEKKKKYLGWKIAGGSLALLLAAEAVKELFFDKPSPAIPEPEGSAGGADQILKSTPNPISRNITFGIKIGF